MVVVLALQGVLTFLFGISTSFRAELASLGETHRSRATSVSAMLDRAMAGNNYVNIADGEALAAYERLPHLQYFRAIGTSAQGLPYEVLYDGEQHQIVRGVYPDGQLDEARRRLLQVRERLASTPQSAKLARVESDLVRSLDSMDLSRRETERLRQLVPPLEQPWSYDRNAERMRVSVALPRGRAHFVFGAQEVSERTQRLVLRLLVPMVPSLMAACVLAFFLSRLIVRPIHELSASLRELSIAGDSAVVAHQERTDELGVLASAFQDLFDTVRYHVAGQTALLDHVDQGLLIVDREGVIQPERSKSARALFGPTRPGETLAQAVGRLDASAGTGLEIAWQLMQGDPPCVDHLPTRFQSGSKGFALRVSPISAVRFLVVVTDVSTIESSRAKSTFLASMSHELRTPLNAIIGYTELMEEGLDDEGVEREDLDAVRRAGVHLLGLVDQILDLSRIESGKVQYVFEEVNLGELISTVCHTLRPQIDAHENTLLVEGNTTQWLFTDQLRLRQILTNLVGNAAKFTREGTIRLVVRSLDYGVAIDVIDDGPGIPSDRLAAVFQPFEQASNQVQNTYGGTGLGLPISLRLAEGMGGELSVRSEVGRGSTFTVVLRRRGARAS